MRVDEFLDEIDRSILRNAMARIEATKFLGEDGKEYFRLPMHALPNTATKKIPGFRQK